MGATLGWLLLATIAVVAGIILFHRQRRSLRNNSVRDLPDGDIPEQLWLQRRLVTAGSPGHRATTADTTGTAAGTVVSGDCGDGGGDGGGGA